MQLANLSKLARFYSILHQKQDFPPPPKKIRVESYHVCFSGARLLSPNETGHLFGTQFGTPFGRPRIFFQEVFFDRTGGGGR